LSEGAPQVRRKIRIAFKRLRSYDLKQKAVTMNQRCPYLLGVGLYIGLLPFAAMAQQGRIAGRIDGLRVVPLPGSAQPQAQLQYDRGSIDPSFALCRITLVAGVSQSQQADLEELLREQQIPTSPNYHRWLTPEQFGERFGLNRGDIAKITAWLESEGFQVEETARARNGVAFSGTAGQVARTFRTEIHGYEIAGEMHFANSSEVSIPASLQGAIGGIYGLNDFNPKPKGGANVSTTIGSHPMTPSDFATIYHVNPLYAAGIDGTGINVAIIGLSEITLSDYRNFRTMFNLPAVDPQMVLVGPSPGTIQAWKGEGLLDS
jgi:subtilase family serine protease